MTADHFATLLPVFWLLAAPIIAGLLARYWCGWNGLLWCGLTIVGYAAIIAYDIQTGGRIGWDDNAMARYPEYVSLPRPWMDYASLVLSIVLPLFLLLVGTVKRETDD